MRKLFEYRDEKSAKFWEVGVADNVMKTRWGKIDTDGQCKEKVFASNAEACVEAEKLAVQKVKKGYQAVDDGICATEIFSGFEKSIEEHRIGGFRILIDRWNSDKALSFYQKGFLEEFEPLVDETIELHPKFDAATRAEIVDAMLGYAEQHLWGTRGREFAADLLYPAIHKILEPGFCGQEVHVDLIKRVVRVGGTAHALALLDAIFKAGVDPNSRHQTGLSRLSVEQPLFLRLLTAGAEISLLVGGEIQKQYLSPDRLEILLNKNIPINVIDKNGRTPLFHLWRTEGNIIQTLTQVGCDINHVDQNGETALSYLMKNGQDSSSARDLNNCSELIRAGANVNCPPNPAPLWFRLPNDINTDASKGVLDFMDRLIESDAPIEQRDPVTGNTALHHWASTQGKMARKICEKLIKAGASVHSRNNLGQTPLMIAAEHHSANIWKLLLNAKSDVNARSDNGYSIAEWAVALGQEPSTEFLQALLGTKGLEPSDEGPSYLSLLGFLISKYSFVSALSLVERGWLITDHVIDTIAKQLGGNMPQSLGLVAEFIATADPIGMSALKSTHFEEIERQVVRAKADGSKVSSQHSFPRIWPPVFPQREKIIVSGLDSLALPPDVLTYASSDEESEFTQYAPKFDKWKRSNSQKGSIRKAKDNNTYDFLRNNHDELFNMFLFAENETLVAMWNDFIGKDINQFYTSRVFPEYYHGSQFGVKVRDEEIKYILSRCGVAALPGIVDAAKKKSNIVCKVLAPIGSCSIAIFIASHVLGSPVSRYAKKWLLRHHQHAIYGLIPTAVGVFGKGRDSSEIALRYLAINGLGNEILEIAQLFGEQAFDSAQEILSVDYAVDYHSGKMPDVPTRLLEAEIDVPVYKESGDTLDAAGLSALYGMMSLSTYDDVYPDLERLLNLFCPDSLSVFSYQVYEIWEYWDNFFLDEGEKKIRKAAEWMYHCLAYMGDDTTVKKLVPYINSWPKSGGMPQAAVGLDILATIGTDFAIRSINGILLKTKYKPLLERADDIMANLADARGLTKAELDDRLVPSFGLDEQNAFTLSFGAREFTILINEKLVPQLLDSDGKRIATLPKANKSDDKVKAKESTERFKTLKADLKAEASNQLFRFEQAMLKTRQWNLADFQSLLVAHPILGTMVRHLIWGVAADGGNNKRWFRVNEFAAFVDHDDAPVSLPAGSYVFIPHPIEMGAAVSLWQEAFVKHRLKQPFPQVGREIFRKKDDLNKDLFGINGGKAPAKAFRGLKSKGWIPQIEDGGAVWSYEKSLSRATAKIDFAGIVTMTDYGIDEDQELKVTIAGGTTELEFSEIVREVKELIH